MKMVHNMVESKNFEIMKQAQIRKSLPPDEVSSDSEHESNKLMEVVEDESSENSDEEVAVNEIKKVKLKNSGVIM